MERPQETSSPGFRRLLKDNGWRAALIAIVVSWNRNQIRRILTAIALIWLAGGTVLYLLESENPANASWGESL